MKSTKRFLLSLALVATLALSACHKPQLEVGGAYNPAVTNSATNADGTVTTTTTPVAKPELALYLTDASYKLAYGTIISVMQLEQDNRAEIQKISPKIKQALDKVRPQVVKIRLRWATARKAYINHPTPEGLSTIQQILAEVTRLVPVVQAELAPMYSALTKP